MKKTLQSGLVAGIVLLILSVLGLYITIWFFPSLAMQYFDPAFSTESSKVLLYYMHPFVISLALSWFWSRFKSILTGSFLTRGIEFGLIYAMVASWFVLAMIQGIIAGLVFEKMNP